MESNEENMNLIVNPAIVQENDIQTDNMNLDTNQAVVYETVNDTIDDFFKNVSLDSFLNKDYNFLMCFIHSHIFIK